MARNILTFGEIRPADLPRVGGKGLNLGELSRIGGLEVPPGFCLVTEAYEKAVAALPELEGLLERLSALKADERTQISDIAGRIRTSIENVLIPEDVASDVAHGLADLGEGVSCAVRSSATAEDLPGASFAGQQDTYLNVKGYDVVLRHVRKCWASLFTDRAIAYRIQNGFDHRRVALSVIVQQMAFPEASGILFTADPVSGNRKTISIDAGFGLGEALVSGIVSADNYRVRGGRIIGKIVSAKKLSIEPLETGGTREQEIEPAKQKQQVLTDERILKLSELGRQIEAHFSAPQDIEWCLDKGRFYILQSRPITTLYPIPEARGRATDDKLHVYVCANHMQMMTDAIKPLGLSFFEVLAKEYADMPVAGGRLFMDISADLNSFWRRKFLLYTFGETDVLIRNTVESLFKQKDLLNRLSKSGSWFGKLKWDFLRWIWGAVRDYRKGDIGSGARFVSRCQAILEDKKAEFEKLSGAAVFDAVQEDIVRLYTDMTKRADIGFLMQWIWSYGWLKKNIKKWLGDSEEHAVDILSKSVPHNPTSEMGLALLDVSNVARRCPAAIDYFKRIQRAEYLNKATLLAGLREVEGGGEVAATLDAFLSQYGARCSGEIDISRHRWNERPTALIPMILNNAENPDSSTGAELFAKGRAEAERKADDLAARLIKLPGGRRKARKTRRMIAIWRGVSGFREYPKFFMIQCFEIYKEAMMREADRMVRKGTIRDREDIFYLTLEELREAAHTGATLAAIERRRIEYVRYEKLTPPRVMTSEGEILHGSYGKAGAPAGALVGMPVSFGVVEGTARVVLRQEDAHIREGDILVTPFTDPSWTPLFISVKGLVTEVGGQMTHGAVITREYGLPAVVGVEDATKKIEDGQKIRVNGSEGWVEILKE